MVRIITLGYILGSPLFVDTFCICCFLRAFSVWEIGYANNIPILYQYYTNNIIKYNILIIIVIIII